MPQLTGGVLAVRVQLIVRFFVFFGGVMDGDERQFVGYWGCDPVYGYSEKMCSELRRVLNLTMRPSGCMGAILKQCEKWGLVEFDTTRPWEVPFSHPLHFGMSARACRELRARNVVPPLMFQFPSREESSTIVEATMPLGNQERSSIASTLEMLANRLRAGASV